MRKLNNISMIKYVFFICFEHIKKYANSTEGNELLSNFKFEDIFNDEYTISIRKEGDRDIEISLRSIDFEHYYIKFSKIYIDPLWEDIIIYLDDIHIPFYNDIYNFITNYENNTIKE